jgi:hypothetical protein
MFYRLHEGDCLESLRRLPDNSVDSLVTDPPCGIGFMGLEFDHHKGGRDAWVAWLREILEECKRVMKPGAIGFVWSLPRTQHWTALACEDAGFEIWDNLGVAHVQGVGLPKGQCLSKAVDKRLGKLGDRGVVGTNPHARPNTDGVYNRTMSEVKGYDPNISAPATPDAAQWDGWRTKALKPAIEFWVAIQKPFKGSCVDNVLEWGVGGINVDAGRVETSDLLSQGASNMGDGGVKHAIKTNPHSSGRYPANFALMHSPNCTEGQCVAECPCEVLGRQSGWLHGAGNVRESVCGENKQGLVYRRRAGFKHNPNYYDNTGGSAARYFNQFDPPAFHYQAKASPRDRNDGTAHLLWRHDKNSSVGWTPCSEAEYEALEERDRAIGNIHATVKSTNLMEHFVKLATPPGGTVLDPFAGSGTTGVAAIRNGFNFIGCEREPHYLTIARARIDATNEPAIEQIPLFKP